MITSKIMYQGNVSGECKFTDSEIIVHNTNKPEISIRDKRVLDVALSKTLPVDVLCILYDEYTLLTSEVACILGVSYEKARRAIKKHCNTPKHAGRRNSRYAQEVSESIRKKMSAAKYSEDGSSKMAGSNNPNFGISVSQLYGDKVRAGVKRAYAEGRLSASYSSEMSRIAWEDGKYDNVNFKQGIGGYMYSPKLHKRHFFRSLLELFYAMYLNEDDSVASYEYEPFRIRCDNSSVYTPDFLVNGISVIELKSRRLLSTLGEEVYAKFKYKCEQATTYCESRGLTYTVLFDDDIGFKGDVFRQELKSGKYIEQYSISFLQPERIWPLK